MCSLYDVGSKGAPMSIPRNLLLNPFLPALVAVAVLHASAASAQSTFATITGAVVDQSGGVLPGAAITVTNVATGTVRTVLTGSEGDYQVPSLDAGVYTLVFELDGFADTTRELTLLARQIVRADVVMQVAGAVERVQVTATQPVIETERPTIDSSRSRDAISKLALNFRATNKTSPIVVATLAQACSRIATARSRWRGRCPS
jgi:hypothetical protein